MDKVTKYRVWWNTDSKYEHVLVENDGPQPAICPVDNTHSIDGSKTRAVDVLEMGQMLAVPAQEDTPTGGKFKVVNFNLGAIDDASNGIWTTKNITIPYPVNMIASRFIARADNEGDIIDLVISPDTIIGAITADIAVDDETIQTNAAGIQYIENGYRIKINGEELGEAYDIDNLAFTFKVTVPATQVHLASAPSYIMISVAMVDMIELEEGRYNYGQEAAKSSHVKENTVIRARYQNNDISQGNKKFIFDLRIFY